MAGNAFRQDDDRITQNPPRRGDREYRLDSIIEGQGRLAASIDGLKDRIDQQSLKIDKIDDLRVVVGQLQTSSDHLQKVYDKLDDRLDKTRQHVIAIVAIGAVLTLLAQIFIPRLWPAPPPQAPVAIAPIPPAASQGGQRPLR